jgi:hypothetical protein
MKRNRVSIATLMGSMAAVAIDFSVIRDKDGHGRRRGDRRNLSTVRHCLRPGFGRLGRIIRRARFCDHPVFVASAANRASGWMARAPLRAHGPILPANLAPDGTPSPHHSASRDPSWIEPTVRAKKSSLPNLLVRRRGYARLSAKGVRRAWRVPRPQGAMTHSY